MAYLSTYLPPSLSEIKTSGMTMVNATEIPNTSWNGSKMDIEEMRLKLSNAMAITLLPVILIISAVMIVSCIGNSMVFYVYLKKFNPSSTRSAILALASFDLVASCLSMPGEILDLRFSHNFYDEAMCKSFRLCTMVVLLASGFTLLVVAVDRYRRICHPMNHQLTSSQTKIFVFSCLLAAMIFSIPAPIMYGISKVHTETEGLYGLECSIDQKYHNHSLPLVYNCILCGLFLAVFSVIIVLYSLLGRQVLRQNKFRLSVKRSLSQEDGDHSITDGIKEAQKSPVPDKVSETAFKPSTDQDAERRQSNLNPQRKMSVIPYNRKSISSDVRTRKTTLMLFIITAMFVVSFLPYLILKGIQATKKDFPNTESPTEMVLYNTFVRSYFFNSVTNCFIYGFCSPKFRRECKQLTLKLFCCSEKK